MSGDQKWQIFIGNVSSGTTDEKLRQVFSAVGHVVNVRVMTDRGDPKKGKSFSPLSPFPTPNSPPHPRNHQHPGYAFVEYDNPDTALTAIQNLSNVEVDGRRLRVGFSNNSGLEAIAKQRGLTITPNGGVTGKSLEGVMGQFSLPEMYDMIAHLKEVAETKPDELRLLLISHPQIAEAIVHMQVKIGMIRPLARPEPQQPPPMHMGGFGGGVSQYLPPPPVPPPQAPQQQWGGPGVGGGGMQLPPPQLVDPAGLGAIGALLAGGNPAASQELVHQILSLTPEQLAAIEPGQRQMLTDLRTALLQGGGAAMLPGGGR